MIGCCGFVASNNLARNLPTKDWVAIFEIKKVCNLVIKNNHYEANYLLGYWLRLETKVLHKEKYVLNFVIECWSTLINFNTISCFGKIKNKKTNQFFEYSSFDSRFCMAELVRKVWDGRVNEVRVRGGRDERRMVKYHFRPLRFNFII